MHLVSSLVLLLLVVAENFEVPGSLPGTPGCNAKVSD